MMTKFPSTRSAATCSKKAGNGLNDPRREKIKLDSEPLDDNCNERKN
jgi:hypothetical protein